MRLEGETDLTTEFPDVENGGGEIIGMGGWDRRMARGTPMLVFGGVGSGGRATSRTAMILGSSVAHSTPLSMPQIAWPSLSLSAVGVRIFIPPSSSTSPTLQRAPSTRSFPNIPPPDLPRAAHQSMAAPAPVVVVIAAAVLVVVLMVGFGFRSLSRRQMASDSGSPDVFDIVHPLGAWAGVVIAVYGGGVIGVVGGGRTSCSLIRGLTQAVGAGYMQSGALGAAGCAEKT
ncbi:hypothetical protein EV421DRAFT_1745534 [Armillaria borealis]|uniref:Uncharacterized protein n=1 Tax=Armillaria borealis TaxID=47425 RepID=A0AA39ITR2_9AGAR|nr:hypothetical protein EV421DRAFT_1745534 [Armillaria borealis]